MPSARPVLALVMLAGALLAGCAKPPVEPLLLEGNRLTVQNQTSEEWTGVEIWLNSTFRVTVKSIAAHQRFDVPLDTFVSGYSQRFNFKRMQITSLVLSARHHDGTPFELKKKFQKSGLAGALGGAC